MSVDRQYKYVLILWGSLTGITVFLGAYISDYLPYRKIWLKYLESEGSDNFLITVVGMLVSIYALALPITINTASEKLAPYGDNDVVNWFKNMWEVYYQRIILPFFIGYILILLFAGIKNGFGCIVVIGFSLYTLIMSYQYFRTIIRISVDTETIVIDWSSKIAKSKLK